MFSKFTLDIGSGQNKSTFLKPEIVSRNICKINPIVKLCPRFLKFLLFKISEENANARNVKIGIKTLCGNISLFIIIISWNGFLIKLIIVYIISSSYNIEPIIIPVHKCALWGNILEILYAIKI